MNVVLFIALSICAIKWASHYLGNLSLLHYMTTKGYLLPTDKEMKACSEHVAKRLFSRKY